MNPIVVTPPGIYPVTVNDAFGQMNVLPDTADALDQANATRFIAAATMFVENYTGFALITRSYLGFMDHWPLAPGGRHHRHHHHYERRFDIPRPPLQAISAITTYDDDDNATVMDPATYFVDSEGFVGRVVLRRGQQWPSACRTANAIKVEWTAGFGDDPTDIPDNYKLALLLMVSHFNEHRDAVVGVENRDSSTALPLGIDALIGPPRLWAV